MNEYIDALKEHWNELVPIHENAVDYYDALGFKSHKMSLREVEREELGDVSGKSLLHLQCHFGQDTLSWATLGAQVTGVDFSDKAIDRARSLSQEIGVEAEFVLSDVYGLPDVLHRDYDIVFTSYGVLIYLPDLQRWAQVISHFLKPGGIFYIAEFHPFAWVFSLADDAARWQVSHPYFRAAEPIKTESRGTYADPGANVSTPSYRWMHSLGDIVNSLTSAGLRIEFLNEFSQTNWHMFPFLEEDDDGWWRPKEGYDQIPLMFSLKAVKELSGADTVWRCTGSFR